MAECTHLARTSAYFDGALPVADEAEAVNHLETCAECQAFLRDAATFDAVLSQAPERPAAVLRRRRWPIAVGAVAIAAAASVAVWMAVPRPPSPGRTDAVAIALPAERAIEARFTGARFGAYRPYDPLRGDRARESIALEALAELERRGDTADLIAGLAATGNLARAGELAAARPDGAAAEADRAAIALAGDAGDAASVALDHAYRAVDRAPDLAVGWWNLALAARMLRLPRVSRAAFARVVAGAEPGWSEEARRQIIPIDRQIAEQDAELAAVEQRGRAMIDGGPTITVDDARRYPAWARLRVLDALCLRGGRTAAQLVAIAEAIDLGHSGSPESHDRQDPVRTGPHTGASGVAAAVARARAGDPAVRAGFAAGYRAVIEHTATPAELDDLLARLRAAGQAVDDVRAAVILRSGRAPALADELRAIVAPWHDPWFDLAVVRAQAGALASGDAAAAALTAALAQATGDAMSARAGQLAGDLAARLRASGRDADAARWAATAIARLRAAGWPVRLPVAAAASPDDAGPGGSRGAVIRAELDESVRALDETRW
jgi:hypothetical protein